MKKLNSILFVIALTIFFGCKKEREFPEVKNLSEYKNTDFNPTLEHKITKDKNHVYCATLLFAWDEVKNQINAPLIISDQYGDLKLLNQSTSYKNVLNKNEYDVSGEIEENRIKATAIFKKSLPFEIKLQKFNNKLVFNGQKVESFGVTGFDDYELLKNVKIAYYKDDNNFIIKLVPKDAEHEIILFKSERDFNSIAEMTLEINKLIEIGKEEKKNNKINWKYQYNYEDIVVIPKFNFNIQTNFKNIEGNKFTTEKSNFVIEEVWQRTAFILDESGAEIESEAIMEASVEELAEDFEEPKPKKMIFDKPFLVLLKRTNIKNPYFALWTTNTELMIEE
jgi:hypothetical protein